MSLTVGERAAAAAVPPMTSPVAVSSLENHPVTTDDDPPLLHTGPSTTTFSSYSDTVATGQAPNVLQAARRILFFILFLGGKKATAEIESN